MTDLREHATPRPTTTTGAEPDPLHNLYRMSRTAGLGSGDYVAINNTSVVAFLLGLASSLALLFTSALVIALAAVVCGILALVQIRSSNGTQTGRAFAALGILLALGFGGATGGKLVIAGVEHRRDEAAIDQLVQRLNDDIVAKRYTEAYNNLFSDGFKKAFDENEFARRWEAHIPVMGEVEKIDWGHRAEINTVRATGEKRAVIGSTVKFSKFPDVATQPMSFLYHDGEWVIDTIGQIFDQGGGGPGDEQQQMPNPLQPQGPNFNIPGMGGPG